MKFKGFTKISVIFVSVILLLAFTFLVKANQEYNQFTIDEESKINYINEIREQLETKEKANVLVWLNAGQSPKRMISELKSFKATYIYESSLGFAGEIDSKILDKLERDKRVNYIVLDQEAQAQLSQSRRLINASLVESTLNITGRNIGVCVVDSGMNYTHQYLAAAYIGGYDFVNNDQFPLDDNGHGTAISGILASTHATTRGIAPGSKIAAVKVLNSAGTSPASRIAAGVDWCVTNKDVYNISIISMSIGSIGSVYTPSSNPRTYEQSLANAYDHNITIVAASGNDGSLTGVTYPAVSPYVISVGATYDANLGYFNLSGCIDNSTYADKIACFSNSPSFVTIMAPGAMITSTHIRGSFGGTYGTSAAAPHVSGTIALMLENNPNLLPEEIKSYLVLTGKIVTDPITNYSFSRVDALNSTITARTGFGCIAHRFLSSNGNLTIRGACKTNQDCGGNGNQCMLMNGPWGICSDTVVC